MFNLTRYNRLIVLSMIPVLCGSQGCKGQKTFGTEYLSLQKEIALPGVHGRIDHIDVDAGNKIVYIAALGNNTLEVVDLKNDKRIHSITGLDEPQGVAFIPEQGEIFVANGGTGECYFYNAVNYKKTGTVRLSSDADDVRYDAASRRIYVAYSSGGIAIIDAKTHLQTGNVPLPAHPEAFQLDNITGRMFVNVPDAGMIAVVDTKSLTVTGRWKRSAFSANFPMALNQEQQQVIVGYRSPARLEIDAEDGRSVNTYPMVRDADDLYYDALRKRIYISGGGGCINIFQQEAASVYRQIANIPTRRGARTSFFVPSLQLLIVAARETGEKEAALMVYKAR